MFSYLFPKGRHLLMSRMISVNIKSRPVGIHGNKSGIERPIKVQNVAPDAERNDVRDHVRQCPQTSDVICPLFGGCLFLILPADDVSKHFTFQISNLRFAPFLGHFVPIVKHFLDPREDEKRCCEVTYERQRRFELDLVAKGRPIGVWFDDVLVPPRRKRTLDLHIFEHPGRIVGSVLCYPPRRNEAEKLLLDDRLRPDKRNIRLLNYLGVFPRRHEALKGIWKLMKRENSFRRRLDHTFFSKTHTVNDSTRTLTQALTQSYVEIDGLNWCNTHLDQTKQIQRTHIG